MGVELVGPLVVLALVDSTSFGTLLIPVWLMLAPGTLRATRVVVFLAVVAGFYLLLGLTLTAGAVGLASELDRLLDSTAVQVVQLAAGVGLLVTGVVLGRRKDEGSGSGRILRWRERAMSGEESVGALAALALTAAALEAATMLPYLAAIGLISTAELAWTSTAVVLVAYCVVMILPALALLGVRSVASRFVTPLLERVNDWMLRNARETTAWIVGIVGFLVARDAAYRLGVLAAIDRLST
jgi:hypothetical protein